ncbi:hypothetical protein EDB89DRAFT_1940236 [Lactarius sanguifluus]|nr:hypothetical protein EDB89DRAFT_1940236 [Lactarius sanguifluus]
MYSARTGSDFRYVYQTSSKGDQSRARFATAHFSRDGRDLVVLSHKRHIVFLRDFERICSGETSLERGGLSLSIRSKDVCCYLGFEHGVFAWQPFLFHNLLL